METKGEILSHIKYHFLDDIYLFKECSDGILKRSIPYKEFESVLHHYDSSWILFYENKNITMVLQYIGLLFLKMLAYMLKHVIGVKERVKFLNEMRSH